MNSKKKRRILVVEDDFMVRQIILEKVEAAGCTVAGEAQDGLQAVEMTQSLQPDLVLMDIDMPKMDGIEATRQIYNTCPTPVVILTAYDTPELVDQAGDVGAGAYLVKMPTYGEIERAFSIAAIRFDDMMKLRHLNALLQDRNEKLKSLNSELKTRNQQLQAAMDKVKILSGLLPICANCKKIRDDQGYWQQVEVYIAAHSDALFSHGVCPGCMEKLYPEIYWEMERRKEAITAVLKKLGEATLEAVSTETGFVEFKLVNTLQGLVQDKQVTQREVDGEIFFTLKK